MSYPLSLPINLPVEVILTETNKTATETPTASNEKPQTRRYWPVPPIERSDYLYQNVNKDLNLRKDVTNFFHRKILKWINEYPEFKHLKTKKSFLESTDGKMHVYRLLRVFVKKANINWYDLRDNYSIVKEYLSQKL